MEITNTERRQLDYLMTLADEAVGFPTIHLHFVSYFNQLREDHGLAMLLLKLREFIKESPAS